MPSREHGFDIAIVGAGLVGASLARALAQSGLSIALVEPQPARPPEDAWDSRIYAISPASTAFLSRIGAWDGLDASRVQPVLRMAVHGDRGSKIEFSAYESGVPALAHIVESGRLQDALWTLVADQPNVRVYSPAKCVALDIDRDATAIALESGEVVRARLVVGADGANSWVREQAGIAASTHSYVQLGVVANFVTERPHHGTAFQWFRTDGVLAFLPLAGRRMSMVWSTPERHAAELLAMDVAELSRRVETAGGHALGALECITPAKGFPLRRLDAEATVKPRLALVGDAAHVVHPLAGQGVNLGFGDAETLAGVLAARESFRDPGDLALLQRYARARAEPVLAMRNVTHGLNWLFGLPGATAGRLRNAGLNLTDRVPVLKTLLVRNALG